MFSDKKVVIAFVEAIIACLVSVNIAGSFLMDLYIFSLVYTLVCVCEYVSSTDLGVWGSS